MRSSWLPLVAVTLLTIAAEGVGVIGVQRQIQAGAQHDATKTAQLISALIVERNMTADDLRARSVTSGSLHDMDADVAKLIGHGQMSGLQVWSIVDGRLMYAAGDRDPSETVLPQDALIRARRGGFSSIGHSRAGIETFDVFVTFDADGDDLPDVVVEVLLYENPINLDGFRQVNETLGRHAGDDLLVAYGNRLAASCRTTETVVRLAGDEFALLLTDVTDGYEVERRVHQLCEPAHQSFEVGGLEVELESIVGFALAPEHSTTAEDLLRAAEVALHGAKRAGVSVAVYDPGVDDRDGARLTTLCAEWRACGRDLSVAVNISARNLADPFLPEFVMNSLADARLPAKALELEITETAVAADPVRALKSLEQIRRTGVTISLDDFGTGYTALAQLSGFPIDGLKIDRTFIRLVDIDRSHQAIVRNIIKLSHDLGLFVVAEGVEEVRTAALLDDLACDFIQGYLLTPPLPPDALVAWLDSSAPSFARPRLASSQRTNRI